MAELGKSNTINTLSPIDVTPSVPSVEMPKSIIETVLFGTDEEKANADEILQDQNLIDRGLSSFEDYFTRAIIIILGFIFVAVGLTMFSGPTPINIIRGSNG